MKTILYNPIFINPQAYYVFPRLTRYLQPDNESTSEPANYIGTIEVKVIAYGDTTLKRTYTNTDSIDLSEFKNTWIRISLFTKVGSCVLGEWKIGNMESDLPYIDPEVLASLKAVVIVGNKTNNDSDRAIVKNLVDVSNPFVISNAAFKLNSGFGGFVEDFTSWDRIDSSTAEISNDGSKIKCINTTLNVQYLFNSINRDIPSFKVKISNFTKGDITYYYRKEDGIEAFFKITPLSVVNSDKVIELPKSYNTVENGTGGRGGFYSSNINIGVTITQIPSFEGAFVTDGIDDLITSTKTASEMGITNEVTVVSMIHQIRTNGSNINRNNFFCNKGLFWFSNNVINSGKTGIYGYTSINNSVNNIINNILGDKNDYSAVGDKNDITPSQFSVVGYIGGSTGEISYTSSVAWYWTIIANKVLTTDQINQVIAYFNLDRTLKPDILCDVKKQGITNDNHAEFGDKLIDFSGNGRDIQLNNLAWKGDSGIGKYEVDFLDSSIWNSSNSTITSSKIDCKNAISHIMLLYYNVGSKEYPDIPSFKVIKTGADIDYSYIDETGSPKSVKIVDGVNVLPSSHNTLYSGSGRFCGFGNPGMGNSVTITQIPSHAGGLCLDGINDFGKVTGMPIYKDYTFIIDYERISYASSEKWVCGVVSKSHVANQGAFILMTANTEVEPGKQAYSFGGVTSFNRDDFTRALLYQSKYKCGDVDLTVGEGVDRDTLWLGTFRDNDQRFFNGAIYSLMSFPYSMSEFLIERQLKKHKLGTLYPNMVEFRPVIKANANYKITYYQIDSTNTWKSIKVGDYIVIGAKLAFQITFDNDASELKEVVSPQLSGIIVEKRPSNPGYNIYSYITSKSPQKINITIDEYIRFEDIVQPYPSLFTLIDYDTEEVYSWGSKLKLGARFKGDVVNLLPNMYEWQGNVLYNGEVLNWGIKPGVVAKEMVFSWNMPFKYLIDNNEPKVILSPRLLRIPNSSYKILGYIPDISGHGNHGVIHNSVYAKGSGVNEDGSYQFDGVDDFVTIPTTVGGKQVLMKVNSRKSDCYLYDQRNDWIQYLGIVSTKDFIAYNYSNQRGKTYIDGILNENITANDLIGITHNITVTNNRDDAKQYSPCIGTSFARNSYAQMALYDFMLFDNISTDDKIKQLNEYVGIEAKVELPPYYWDAYGKTNLDGDKATIQQRGVAVGDYDLTNTNFAYDKMSGFGGYEFAKFDNTLDWYNTEGNDSVEVVSRNGYSITLKRLTGLYFWYFQNSGVRGLISNDIPFKINSNKNITVIWDVHGLSISEGKDKSVRVQELVLNPNEDNYTNLKALNEEELAQIDISTNSLYYLLWFDLSTLAVNEEVTIEMLPLYPNALVYDGIIDYSENTNIPALTDYTYVFKRELLNLDKVGGGASLYKGSFYSNGGRAFIVDINDKNPNSEMSGYSYGNRASTSTLKTNKIIYGTKTSVNGVSVTPGSNTDNASLTLGKWDVNYKQMVFYKLILYPKTIPLLQINFLKNLMERDEIIDLNNKIFIQE